MKKLLFIFLLLPLFVNSQVTVGHSLKCDTKTNINLIDSVFTDNIMTYQYDTINVITCDTTFYVIKPITKDIAGFDSPNLALIQIIDGDIIVLGGIVKDGVFIGGKGRYFWYQGIKKNLPFDDLTEDEIKKLKEL